MPQTARNTDNLPGKPLNLALEQRAEMVDDARWVQDFEWSQIQTLTSYMLIRSLDQDTLIFREGTNEAYMGLVLKGRLNIIKEDVGGNNKVIATLGRGMTFGEMSIIDHEPRSATAIAASETTIALLTAEALEQMMRDYPRLGQKVILKLAKLMSQRLRDTSGRLIDHLAG